MRAGTCSLSYYERVAEDRSTNRGLGEWSCRLNGSTDHLKQGEEVSGEGDGDEKVVVWARVGRE